MLQNAAVGIEDLIGQLVAQYIALQHLSHGDDIMLNYQTTGFRETAALREITGKTAIPEFQRWLEKMGFVENGRLTKKAGDGSSLLF